MTCVLAITSRTGADWLPAMTITLWCTEAARSSRRSCSGWPDFRDAPLSGRPIEELRKTTGPMVRTLASDVTCDLLERRRARLARRVTVSTETSRRGRLGVQRSHHPDELARASLATCGDVRRADAVDTGLGALGSGERFTGRASAATNRHLLTSIAAVSASCLKRTPGRRSRLASCRLVGVEIPRR